MALRSLVVKMKALPRQVPGPRAFANAPKPKDGNWGEIMQELENSSKYSSTKELARAIEPMLEEGLRATKEKVRKDIWRYRGLTLLLTVVGFSSAGYLRAYLRARL
ncbi:hypothetical protein U9M48_034076 [Paspalum notatum var. saurae]|uniref:Uncharacterized protein n=1 Tax=Paspalum notatum var. saurae TaxID=547442 RepID=A0AAQ3UC08_PASNO